MQNPTPYLPDRIIFVADVHLGLPGDTPGRAERFAAFLRELRGCASQLYIVGDLFDFWFEYRTVIPRTAPVVIFELYNLVRAGTAVTLLAGNHDYWFGEYLRNDVGLALYPNECIAEHQGKRLFVHHGDGFYPRDHGYRILKRVLRNRLSIALFRLIHPDFARSIAEITSTTSRKYLAPPPGRDEQYARLFREVSDRKLAEGFDAAVYGHSHVSLLEQRERGTLILLGDWINRSTYVVLENGQFTIHEWQSEAEAKHG